jgi:hypothetical protein
MTRIYSFRLLDLWRASDRFNQMCFCIHAGTVEGKKGTNNILMVVRNSLLFHRIDGLLGGGRFDELLLNLLHTHS